MPKSSVVWWLFVLHLKCCAELIDQSEIKCWSVTVHVPKKDAFNAHAVLLPYKCWWIGLPTHHNFSWHSDPPPPCSSSHSRWKAQSAMLFSLCRWGCGYTDRTAARTSRVWTSTILYTGRQPKTSSVWKNTNTNRQKHCHRWVHCGYQGHWWCFVAKCRFRCASQFWTGRPQLAVFNDLTLSSCNVFCTPFLTTVWCVSLLHESWTGKMFSSIWFVTPRVATVVQEMEIPIVHCCSSQNKFSCIACCICSLYLSAARLNSLAHLNFTSRHTFWGV